MVRKRSQLTVGSSQDYYSRSSHDWLKSGWRQCNVNQVGGAAVHRCIAQLVQYSKRGVTVGGQVKLSQVVSDVAVVIDCGQGDGMVKGKQTVSRQRTVSKTLTGILTK